MASEAGLCVECFGKRTKKDKIAQSTAPRQWKESPAYVYTGQQKYAINTGIMFAIATEERIKNTGWFAKILRHDSGNNYVAEECIQIKFFVFTQHIFTRNSTKFTPLAQHSAKWCGIEVSVRFFANYCGEVWYTQWTINKKLITRWDSERELFTTTSYTHYKITTFTVQ